MEYIDEKQLIAMALTQRFINNIKANEEAGKKNITSITLNDVQNIAMGLSCKLYEKGIADYIFLNDGYQIVSKANEMGLNVFQNSFFGYIFTPKAEMEWEFYKELKDLEQNVDLSEKDMPSECLSVVSKILGIKDLSKYQEGEIDFDPRNSDFTTRDRVDAFKESFKAQTFEFLEKGTDRTGFYQNPQE